MSPRMESNIRGAKEEALAVCATGIGALCGARWETLYHRGGIDHASLDAPEWIAAGSVQGCSSSGTALVTAVERGAA